MAKPKNRSSKLPTIILAIVAAVVLVAAVWYMVAAMYWKNYQPKAAPATDAEQFQSEYPKVTDQNPFLIADSKQVLSLFDNGSGIVFLGFTQCPWCQSVAPLLEKAAVNEGLDKVYYFDIRQDRMSGSDTYDELIAKLKPYLQKDDQGKPVIYVPDISAVKNGEIIGRFEMEKASDQESSSQASYWTPDRKDRTVSQLQKMIRKL